MIGFEYYLCRQNGLFVDTGVSINGKYIHCLSLSSLKFFDIKIMDNKSCSENKAYKMWEAIDELVWYFYHRT